jgi:hypothetical protein
MPGLRSLLVPLIVTAVLAGLGLPANADADARPLERPVAGEVWGPLRQVPVPQGNIDVLATAISDQGHIAVAYHVGWRTQAGRVPGYVIVRGPRGVWGAPHRLNPRNTVINDVALAFDTEANLTAFWSFDLGPPTPPPPIGYAVATKPAGREWSSHLPVGPVQVAPDRVLALSVAPAGPAIIGWWQLDSGGGFQFTVRVRASADAPWGPAQVLSSYPRASLDRNVNGDVAINDNGNAIAAWKACQPGPGVATCEVQRSRLRPSGTWTAPATVATEASQFTPVEVASTPSGFTATTWVRRLSGIWRTVVALRSASGIRLRVHAEGAHYGLAVGPRAMIVMIKRTMFPNGGISAKGLQVTWRYTRTWWITARLAPRQSNVDARHAPAVDGSGRMFVPWSQIRQPVLGEPIQEKGLISTHVKGGWRTTRLWNWAPNAHFAAAAVSPNGRAVAIRTVTNAQATNTAVGMRVLRPG